MLVKSLQKLGSNAYRKCVLKDLIRNYSTPLPLSLHTDEEAAMKSQGNIFICKTERKKTETK